jgi:predicted metal-dependent phosphoesterase TrpH
MSTFIRTKAVSVQRIDEDLLKAHGVLEDDIYGLEIDVVFHLSDLEIRSIQGKWTRMENSLCHLALPFLQESVGFKIRDGYVQEIQKTMGRKACRHFANILIECCESVTDASLALRWERARAREKDLTLEAFLKGESPRSGEKPLITASAPADRPAVGTPPERGTTEGGDRRGTFIDLHVHTREASPCSSAPVDRLIEEAKRIGLAGICLTDHNHVWSPSDLGRLSERHGFLVLGGNEITTDQGDVLVFGFEEEIKGIIRLEELRPQVLKRGGVIIAAHPFRGFLTFGIGQLGLTPQNARERPLFRYVDAVEVLNSKVSGKENSFSKEVAVLLGLPGTGGSDAHEVAEVGIYATRFSRPIRNHQDLIEALRSREYMAVPFREHGIE